MAGSSRTSRRRSSESGRDKSGEHINPAHRETCLEKDHTAEAVSGRDCVEEPGKSSERWYMSGVVWVQWGLAG